MALRLRRHRDHRANGQSLVEFALVFPLFMIILFFVIEFAFALNAYLAIDFASREGALAAAEAGTETDADCSILNAVERSIGAPADARRIEEVMIYKSTSIGDPVGGVGPTRYTRGGSITCTRIDLSTYTLPYTRTANGYPPSARCNILAGCTGSSTASVDTIGVQVTYDYNVKTPVYSLLNQGNDGWTMTKANAMRMEPVL